MVKYCKCGCGTEIADDKTWVHNHHWRGKTHSDETKEKMRQTKLGKTFSDEHKEKIRQSRLGKTHTDETKEKMSQAQSEKTLSDEHKEKIRQGNLGKTFSDEHKQHLSDNHADFSGEKHPMFGKHHSDETKEKLRDTIIMHHYIYDFDDWTKYTIPVTRSEHGRIHANLKASGLEIPCINILKEEYR